MSQSIITTSGAFLENAGGINFEANMGITVLENSSIPRDTHIEFERVLIKTADEELRGVKDIMAAGLVKRVGSLRTSLIGFEQRNAMTPGAINMDGRPESEKDVAEFNQVYTPLPFYRKDFRLGIRETSPAANGGDSLNTSQIEEAVRSVSQDMERTLFLGAPHINAGGNTLPGYCNHPKRNLVTLKGAGWLSPSDRDIMQDTKNMIQAALDDGRRGPFMMYVNPNVQTELQLDYSDKKGDNTWKERIEQFESITEVKSAEYVPEGQVLLVELKSSTIELHVAQDIVSVEYDIKPLSTMFAIWGAMVAVIKYDINGSCGVVHGTV